MGISQDDNDGNLRMIDVSEKENSFRTAEAEGCIKIKNDILEKIKDNKSPKGNVLAVSKTAGILGVKQTPLLVPMCHPINITHCDIRFRFKNDGLEVIAVVKSYDRTGVEMEALTAVSITLLNIYDMVKSMDKTMEISDIRLVRKSGGKSGEYVRKD